MAVTEFKLYRRGAIKRRTDGSRFATIEYVVKSDDVDEDQNAILNHVDCPQNGDEHPDNSDLKCTEAEVDEWEGNDNRWIVTVNFDTRLSELDYPQGYDDYDVEGSMSVTTTEQPAFVDTFGNPLTNDADDLYEGLTKQKRLIRYNVSAAFGSHPNSWAKLVGTVNAAAITIHGETYPAGTAMMLGLDAGSKPSRDGEGTLYWRGGYPILIDLDGWISILPNRGYRHYVYQTRATTSDDWVDVSFADYDDESDADLKRQIKVRITDDAEGDFPERGWLNQYGQEVTGSLTTKTVNVTASAASSTIVFSSGAIDEDDIGKGIVIPGAGFLGRVLVSRITEAPGGSTAGIADTIKTAVTGSDAFVSGVFVKRFQIEDLADWTDLPLPNNEI